MKIFDHDKKVIHDHLKTGPGRGLYDFHLCHFAEGRECIFSNDTNRLCAATP